MTDEFGIKEEFEEEGFEPYKNHNYNEIRKFLKNETNVVELFSMFPPKIFVSKESLSISALKAIYSIVYENPLFVKCEISYDKSSFANMGLGYAIREKIYNGVGTKKEKEWWRDTIYLFLSSFIDEPSSYTFDRRTLMLNLFIQNWTFFRYLMLLLSYLYYILCVGG